MNEYISYYHEDRTHLALEKEAPAGQVAAKNSGVDSRVIAMPKLSHRRPLYPVENLLKLPPHSIIAPALRLYEILARLRYRFGILLTIIDKESLSLDTYLYSW